MEYTVNHNYFSEIDAEEKAYFIGLLMADGCVSCKRGEYKTIRLHLSLVDIDIIEKFKRCVKSNHKISITENSCELKFTSQQMADDLSRFGIVPQKSTRENPHFDSIPKSLLKYTIRGLFDGDGWYTGFDYKGKYKTNIGICGSYDVCEYVRDYFYREIGLNDKLKVVKVKDKDCYKIGYSSKNDFIKIYNHMYRDANIFINRKYDNIHKVIENIYKQCTPLLDW